MANLVVPRTVSSFSTGTVFLQNRCLVKLVIEGNGHGMTPETAEAIANAIRAGLSNDEPAVQVALRDSLFLVERAAALRMARELLGHAATVRNLVAVTRIA